MARNAFPAHLRKELRKFYFTSWAPEPDNDAEFFDELPTWLRIKTSADLLSTSPLLGGMLSEGSDKILTREQREVVLRILAAFSLPTHLSPTHVLCKPGDQAQHVYLLEEGELLMLVPGLREPTVVSAPAIVGLGALLASDVEQCRTRSTTLIAATSCMVWKVDAGGMRRQLNNKVPEALLYFMRQFASQLRNMLAHANAQPLKPPALQALIARCEASLAALAELEPLQVQQVENFKKMAEESAAAGKYSRTSMALSSSLSVSQIDEENQTHVEEVLERRHEIVQEAREKAQEGEQGVAAKQGDVAFLM